MVTSDFSRRRLLLGGLAAGTVGLGSALSVAAPASAETTYRTHSSIPSNAGGYLAVMVGNRNMGLVTMSGGRVAYRNLGWKMPVAVSKANIYGSAGGDGKSFSSIRAIGEDGYLYEFLVRESYDSQGRSTSQSWTTTMRYGNGWQGTLDWELARKSGHIYRLTTGGVLSRYRLDSSGRITGGTAVFSNGRGIRSICFDRTITHQGAPADVLLANTMAGDLREYILPHANPAKWSSRILRPAGTGWQQFTKMTVQNNGTAGRIITALNDARQVRVYVDPKRGDFSGADIKGGATAMPALPSNVRPA